MNLPFPCIFPLCHVMTVSKFSCLLGDFFEGITNRPVLYKFHILAYIHKHIPINSYLCIYKHRQKYVCIYKNLTLFSKYIALLHQPVLGDPNAAGPGSVQHSYSSAVAGGCPCYWEVKTFKERKVFLCSLRLPNCTLSHSEGFLQPPCLCNVLLH